jgi:hypothetical protein
MGRAARLKRERKASKDFAPKGGQTIQLCNPETNNFEVFIAGNATVCRNPVFHDESVTCTIDCMPMVEQDSAKGQHLVLCGAGPSLTEHAAEYCPKADQVWGCNSAATWLYKNGHKLTHGFAIDQTTHMVAEWIDPPPAEYILATTVHTHLVEHLVRQNLATRFFHNFVGIKKPPVEVEPGYFCEYEDFLYMTFYGPTIRAGSGLNAVTRAIDVALFMGFETVDVLGADCCLRTSAPRPIGEYGSAAEVAWLRDHTVMHADGGNALASGATPVTLDGEIDGRIWTSKPDMLISAQWLMRMARSSKGRVRLIGDTLPNALMNKDEAFLARLPALTDSNGASFQYPGELTI